MNMPLLFALESSRAYGAKVARALGLALAEHEERTFGDGERKLRPLAEPGGRDVYVLQSLFDEPSRDLHGKLCDLLFLIGALKDAGAARVTAIAPYLCYARQDQRTSANDPLSLRYLAQLFDSAGTDAILALDVHNAAAFENAFHMPARNIEAAPLFAAHFSAALAGEEIEVISPDIGGVKRAERFRDALKERVHRDIPVAAISKKRLDHISEAEEIPAGVLGRTAIIFDDMIATGSTMLRAAKACRRGGAKRIFAAATHGLFLPGSQDLVASDTLDGVVVADTVSPFPLDPQLAARKVTVLDSTALLANVMGPVKEH
jgi:ribose-phosphate pyrophosphokinase